MWLSEGDGRGRATSRHLGRGLGRCLCFLLWTRLLNVVTLRCDSVTLWLCAKRCDSASVRKPPLPKFAFPLLSSRFAFTECYLLVCHWQIRWNVMPWGKSRWVDTDLFKCQKNSLPLSLGAARSLRHELGKPFHICEWLRGESAELLAAVRVKSSQELPLPGIFSQPLTFLS